MITFTRFLITVPIILMTPLAAGLRPALAEGAPAQQAVEILARAGAADSQCRVLSEAERDELGRYTARAEIAAASQVSVDAARGARARGEAAGKTSGCSGTTAADVRETLAAARQAMAESTGRIKAETTSRQDAAKTGNRSKAARAEGDPDLKMAEGASGLKRYGHLVEAYYLERECRYLPKPEADRFWRAIVRVHKAAIARNGANAVAPIKRRAERQARFASCGSASMNRVKSSYAEILTR